MGPEKFKRAYRMEYETFVRLGTILRDKIVMYSRKSLSQSSKARGCANGIVTHQVRLAITLRYFAGGSILDSIQTYQVSHASAHESIWFVTQAIIDEFPINCKFPTSKKSN